MWGKNDGRELVFYCSTLYVPRPTNTSRGSYLIDMGGASGNDVPALSLHEVEQLVDEEGGWKGAHATSGDSDGVAADRAPKRV